MIELDLIDAAVRVALPLALQHEAIVHAKALRWDSANFLKWATYLRGLEPKLGAETARVSRFIETWRHFVDTFHPPLFAELGKEDHFESQPIALIKNSVNDAIVRFFNFKVNKKKTHELDKAVVNAKIAMALVLKMLSERSIVLMTPDQWICAMLSLDAEIQESIRNSENPDRIRGRTPHFYEWEQKERSEFVQGIVKACKEMR